MFKNEKFVSFQVYLKSGEKMTFTKLISFKEEPSESINEVLDVLIGAMNDRKLIKMQTDNYELIKSKIFTYSSFVIVDGADISAVNTLVLE